MWWSVIDVVVKIYIALSLLVARASRWLMDGQCQSNSSYFRASMTRARVARLARIDLSMSYHIHSA